MTLIVQKNSPDELTLVMAARAAVDELLGRYLRIGIAKAVVIDLKIEITTSNSACIDAIGQSTF
jgi:hypothetical protein